MATLVDTFMEDCEDSEDDIIFENNNQQPDQEMAMEEDIFSDMEDIIDIDLIENEYKDSQHFESVETVSDLLDSDRLKLHLRSIKESIEHKYEKYDASGYNRKLKIMDYELIKESNLLILEIENHILRIHKFICDIYSTKFPELSSMVINPLEYAKCVKLIGNKTSEQMSDLNLRHILNNPSVAMTVHVTATTTNGKNLQTIDLERCLHACNNLIKLNDKKLSIQKFVSSKMNIIAPNVSALIGEDITAKLIGFVGGIKELSQIPSCNIQVLGSIKKNTSFLGSFQIQHGNYKNESQPHFGIIASCELIGMCPKHLQQKALRTVSAKTVLAARVDANMNMNSCSLNNNNNNNNNNGEYGKKLYHECIKKISKWQEAPPPKPPRPRLIPDTKPKKKRGGKRYRKMRERYRVTETQKMQNRMAFNKAETEIIDGNGERIGLGMLGNAADVGGRLRTIKPKTMQSALHKIHNRQVLKQKRMRMRAEKAGTVTGLTTSVVFTAVQGIELSNPDSVKKNKLNKSKYFNQD